MYNYCEHQGVKFKFTNNQAEYAARLLLEFNPSPFVREGNGTIESLAKHLKDKSLEDGITYIEQIRNRGTAYVGTGGFTILFWKFSEPDSDDWHVQVDILIDPVIMMYNHELTLPAKSKQVLEFQKLEITKTAPSPFSVH